MGFYAIRDYSPILVTGIADTTGPRQQGSPCFWTLFSLYRFCANKNLYFNFRIDPGRLYCLDRHQLLLLPQS